MTPPFVPPSSLATAVPCRTCGESHSLEQPYKDRQSSERDHIYVTCRGQRYFVGVVDPRGAPLTAVR